MLSVCIICGLSVLVCMVLLLRFVCDSVECIICSLVEWLDVVVVLLWYLMMMLLLICCVIVVVCIGFLV